MRLPHLGLLAALIGTAAPLCAESFDDRVTALFRRPLGEMITLSPDGLRIAYTAQDERGLAIVVRSIEPPGPRRTVKLDPERDSAGGELPPTQLRYLRWAPNGRLVFAPVERVVPLPPIVEPGGRMTANPDGPTIVSPILAMDADGKQRGALIDARDFQETPEAARRSLADFLRTPKEMAVNRNEPVRWRMPHIEILGFHPRDRDQLIVQTHGAYSMPMQHLVDLRTGSVREFGTDWPAPPGEPQIFDGYRLKVVGERKEAARPATAWRDDEFAKVQQELERKFPRRVVEILDWSETRSRVLFRVTGGSEAGRIFVHQRAEDIVLEILQRAPWLAAAKLNETRFFECNAADGARLSGYVTWPAKRAAESPPLLVIFPTGFPGHAQPAFDPEAQVFADLGFAVLRLNHRGVAGLRNEDLTALRSAVDRVSVDDARAAIEWIATRFADRAIDRKRAVAFGRGFGGYLAVRALQLQPALFRCGVAIDAPTELRAWLRAQSAAGGEKRQPDIPSAVIDHAGTDWKSLSVVEQADALTQPVFLLLEPARNAAAGASLGELRARLQGLGRAAEYAELDAGFAAEKPASRAEAYRKIDAFMKAQLHGFGVKLGAPREVK